MKNERPIIVEPYFVSALLKIACQKSKSKRKYGHVLTDKERSLTQMVVFEVA